MDLLRKQKQAHRHREQTYGCQGEERGRMFRTDMCALLYSN